MILQLKHDFDFDSPIDIWIEGTVVDKPVKGLVNLWEPGDDISVRGEWVRPIEKVGEPLKTTEELHSE